MLLFYVRHGDPTYDPDCLTELGHRQAEALVGRMYECKPDKIYASTSTRAVQTAQPTARALGKEIIQMDWCHENHAWQDFSDVCEDGTRTWIWDVPGAHEKLVSAQVAALGKEWYRYPGFEKYEAGIKRIQTEADAWLLSLGYRHDTEKNGFTAVRPNDDRIALFAHEGFGAAFLSCILDIPFPMFSAHFEIGHTGVTVISFSGEGFFVPRVLQVSNDSHIFAAGMSTDYKNYLHF